MSTPGLPEYDRNAVPDVGDHAVVVGGSMAGLVAARVLADGFEEVTVFERDPLPDGPEPRDGVPHSPHTHGINDGGRGVYDELFSGFTEELLDEGAILGEFGSDVRAYRQQGFIASGSDFPHLITASRPLFEHMVRRRVASMDPVRIRPECQVKTYLADESGTGVDGVEIRNSKTETEEVEADVVVDATGKVSRTPTWLEQHGYPTPRVETVDIDVSYSSVVLERPPDDHRSFFVHTEPPRTRNSQTVPIEGGRWVMSHIGVAGDHPPTDIEGFREFAASFPTSAVVDLLDEHPMVSEEVQHYPFPASRWHHYEELDRVPSGLIVMGDAFCHTNPIYGLGMTSAIFQAISLHLSLAAGDLDGIERRFFQGAARGLEQIWSTAALADKKYPHTDGEPSFRERLFNWYVKRLQRRAHTDSEVSRVLCNLTSMTSANLLQPRIVWRVLRPTLPG